MSDPRLYFLRLQQDMPSPDGIVRISDAVARAVADHMPALALTDLGNFFRAGQVLLAARGKAEAIAGGRCLADPKPTLTALAPLLLCRGHKGYLRLCEILSGHNWRPHPRRPRSVAADAGRRRYR